MRYLYAIALAAVVGCAPRPAPPAVLANCTSTVEDINFLMGAVEAGQAAVEVDRTVASFTFTPARASEPIKLNYECGCPTECPNSDCHVFQSGRSMLVCEGQCIGGPGTICYNYACAWYQPDTTSLRDVLWSRVLPGD